MRLKKLPGFFMSGVASILLAAPAYAQTTGGISGQIVDANTQNPVTDAVVIATSQALQGEQTAVTDASGNFEITLLPAGVYQINVQREGYQAFTQDGLRVNLDKTVRVKLSILPDQFQGAAVEIIAQKPTIAVTSTEQGGTISKEQMSLTPYGRGARGFEQVVQAVPGVHADPFGATINGSGSSETNYIVDGVSVNDPAYGSQGTTLIQDFVQEIDVKTGGFQAEYGRSTGGIVNVVTKSGGNEFHGSVFVNFTPLEATRKQPVTQFAVNQQAHLNSNIDFGAEIGGPILKDRLWFYAGFAPQFISTKVDRVIQAQTNNGAGGAVLGPNGVPLETEVGRQPYTVTNKSYQFTSKLTFLANENHSIALAVYGNPTTFNNATGIGNDAAFLGTTNSNGSYDVSLRYSGKLMNKTMLVEAGLGYHYQIGSAYQPSQTFQNVGAVSAAEVRDTPQIQWRGIRNLLDPVFDDGTIPSSQKTAAVLAACAISDGFNPCPVQNYLTGGTGYFQGSTLKRIAPTLKLSNFVDLAGHHQFKYGIDAAFDQYHSDKFYTGGQQFRNYSAIAGNGGTAAALCGGLNDCFYGVRGFGHGSLGNTLSPALAPNAANPFAFADAELVKDTVNKSFSEFVQDTWSIFDKVNLDVGVRFEQQRINPDSATKNGQGQIYQAPSIALNDVMPRVGLTYDFTGRGLSKVYASYGRFYEYIPLDLADRSLSNEASVNYQTNSANCSKGLTSAAGSQAFDPRSCALAGAYRFAGAAEGVDPILQSGWNHGQYSDQYQGGIQYQVYRDISLGVDYVRQQLGQVIEDMSADDGTTYFLSNPGAKGALGYQVTTASGQTIVEPAPRRIYDGVTLSARKDFSDNYYFTASYTYSSFRGNYPGLFVPEYSAGQLDPNITAEYDLVSLLPNRDGPLYGDINNSFKLNSGYVYEIDPRTSLQLGGQLAVNSGDATNYLGAHNVYGAGAAYILPRGSGPRLPWNWQLDLRAGLNYKLGKDYALGFRADVFNVTNNQATLNVDQNYTFNAVYPIPNGKPSDLAYLRTTAGVPVVRNLNYGLPTQYQLPLSARFGATLSF